jgi:hypothetical protein
VNMSRCGSIFVVLAALAAVTFSPTVGIAAGSHTPTPSAVVRTFILPFTHQGTNNFSCNGLKMKLAKCPLTSRLRADLARYDDWAGQHQRGGGGNPFCLCQNLPQRVSFGAVSGKGTSALVRTVWSWGLGDTLRLTFVLRYVGAAWLIDNEFCAQYRARDLYHFPIFPCDTVIVQLRPIGHVRVRGSVTLLASGARTIALVEVYHLALGAQPFAVIHAGSCSDLAHLSASSLFLPALEENAQGTATGAGRGVFISHQRAVHGPDAGGSNQNVLLSALVRFRDVIVVSTRQGLVACGRIA